MPFIIGEKTGGGGGGGGNVNAPSPPLVFDDIVIGLGGTDVGTVGIAASTTAVVAPVTAAVIINTTTPSVIVGFNSLATNAGLTTNLIIYGYNNVTDNAGVVNNLIIYGHNNITDVLGPIDNFIIIGTDIANQSFTGNIENVICIGSGITAADNNVHDLIVIGHNIFGSPGDDHTDAIVIGSDTCSLTLEIDRATIIGGDSFTSGVSINSYNVSLGYGCGNTYVSTGMNNLLLGANTDVRTATSANEINIADTIFGSSATQHLRVGGLLATALNVSAAFEVNSTTGGILFPNMTTVQKNALTAVPGLVVFDTDLSQLQVYDGTIWAALN